MMKNKIKQQLDVKASRTYRIDIKTITDEKNLEDSFHIVGISGGAGAIKSFELFFSAINADTGMAFIVFPQIENSQLYTLVELIQNASKMKVFIIENGMKVQQDCIYINSPERGVLIQKKLFNLLEPESSLESKMPVNLFFNQLAKDAGEKSICIIFSGIGNDGIQGLRAIKEKLGLIMVQAPETAEYSAMPLNAINTNLVDYIVPVEEMPTKLIEYIRHIARNSGERYEAIKDSIALQKIFNLIRNQTGHDFSMYKKNTMLRRIERRINIHQLNNISDYETYLQENLHEVNILFSELLIGVTSFFREPEAFEYLKLNVIPNLLKGKMKEKKIRIWITGCSTGEEAYSIAIIIRECLENLKMVNGMKVFIFATDINNQAIEIARQGVYPSSIADNVSIERLIRFFVKTDDGNYMIKKEIREMIVFAPHNVIMDPPFIKLDMLCCRNLLIYFSTELQKKLLPIFHYSLNLGGVLFLGSSETIGECTSLFSVMESKLRIFERKESMYSMVPMIEFISSPVTRENTKNSIVNKNINETISDKVQKVLLEDFTPPAVVINENGDIIYISGRTGNYLEPSPGKANLNIFAMAREGIKYELGKAIHSASVQRKSIDLYGLTVKLNSGYQCVNITVSPLKDEENISGLLIVVFKDVISGMNFARADTELSMSSEQTAAVMELEDQLMNKNEYLQSTIEEMETSQEELKSMNEELQLTNEEMQSTNEELKTSREELQSLNEELLTINSEMQIKNDELSQSNNDMRNLLYSTQIATIFLDNNLNIKRFTPEMTKIISLIQTDVGRPISDIVQKLKYSNLISDVKEVLETLVFKELQVETIDENWFNMRILPYRTVENVIDGVVITFSDITVCKRLEESLARAKSFADCIIATVREPMVVLDEHLKVVSANNSFYKKFQVSVDETEKRFIYELGNCQWDIPELRRLLEDILPDKREFEGFIVTHEFPMLGLRTMMLNSRIVYTDRKDSKMILLAFEDVTDCKKVNLNQ